LRLFGVGQAAFDTSMAAAAKTVNFNFIVNLPFSCRPPAGGPASISTGKPVIPNALPPTT
jgi:hypothetical protein